MRSHNTLNRLKKELLVRPVKVKGFKKRALQTTSMDENENDAQRDWITDQITANVWKMLENRKSVEPKQYRNDIDFPRQQDKKYFRTT